MNYWIVLSLLSCTLLAWRMTDKATPDNAGPDMSGKHATTWLTARDTKHRLDRMGTKTFHPAKQPLETEIAVFVNPNKTFQSYVGIGGAVTDASAEVFAGLPAEKQEEFLRAYFDRAEGIGYNLIRTNIHSCDFSSGSYTYIEEGDKDLHTFSVAHDKVYRIPMIHRIQDATGGALITYASPWSPPAFMKDNHNMLRGGKLLPEYADAWARYYTRFISAYEAEGIPIWGISIQNEPMATQRWESCIYTAEEERDFLRDHLGPTMEKAGFGDRKIIAWDHNRDLITHRADVILGDPEAAKYVWGIGFHWYETWTKSLPMFDNVAQVNNSYPDKQLIFTEGCNEKFDVNKYQYWPNAERYGRSMINDFNRGTVAWTDWNILLDQTGGPNHVGNFCFAPIHADTTQGELIYTPSYYYIGHFSKFIQPGAKRVSSVPSRDALLSTSFLNPDGQLATIIMNQTDTLVTYKLYVGDHAIEEKIAGHAIETVVF